MNNKQKDGGSAFPMIEGARDGQGQNYYFSVGGMTLRDWFAGQALAGILANPEIDIPADDTAEIVYRYADAMIAERETRNDQL